MPMSVITDILNYIDAYHYLEIIVFTLLLDLI